MKYIKVGSIARPKLKAEKKKPHRVKVGGVTPRHSTARHALAVGALVGITKENHAAYANQAGGYVF